MKRKSLIYFFVIVCSFFVLSFIRISLNTFHPIFDANKILFCYKDENIYIFESNKGEIDSFEYISLYRFNSSDNFYESYTNDINLNSHIFNGYNFRIYNSQKKYYGYFSLPGSSLSRFWETFVTKKYRVSFGIYENNIYSNILKSLDILKSDSHDFKLMDFEMNGNIYKDCIIGENDVSSGQNLAEKYVISKKLGLLYFKLRTGEEFFRIRPLPGKIYLTIDGEPIEAQFYRSLMDLVVFRFLDRDKIEVSLNGRVISKDNWRSTLLSDGDSISIECDCTTSGTTLE